MTPDDLSERLWQFAARVGKVVDALPDRRLAAMWPDNWPNQLLLPNRMAAADQSHRRPSQFEIFIYQLAKSIITAKSNRRRRSEPPPSESI